jgi:hypothetical protein
MIPDIDLPTQLKLNESINKINSYQQQYHNISDNNIFDIYDNF